MGNSTTNKPPEIGSALAAKRGQPEAVLDHFGEGADLIVGLGNGEPVTVLDAIEASAERLSGVTVHQMLPLRKRRYMHGDFAGLRHVSWFLSPANREAFHEGTCDLVPNNFSDVPRLMRRSTRRSLVLAASSPPDRHGYFSLGPHADRREEREEETFQQRRPRVPGVELPEKEVGGEGERRSEDARHRADEQDEERRFLERSLGLEVAVEASGGEEDAPDHRERAREGSLQAELGGSLARHAKIIQAALMALAKPPGET